MEPRDVLKIILYLFGFCALLFLTYVTTKYVGQVQNKSMKSKNINVIETVMLGADKRLHLVKAGREYIVIASTAKTVEFIAKIDLEEDVEQETAQEEKGNTFDFKSLFEKYTGQYRNNRQQDKNRERAESPQDMADERDFKSNLSRLKRIVNTNQVKENGDDNTNEK